MLINNTIDSLDNDCGKLEIFDSSAYYEMLISVLSSYVATEKMNLTDNELKFFDKWLKTYAVLRHYKSEVMFSMYDVYMDCKKDIEYSKQYKKGVA